MPTSVPTRILVAPSGFKESLSPEGVCQAVAAGVRRLLPGAVVVELPLVDGGEGSAATMARATGGDLVTTRVTGPVGEPVDSYLARLGGSAQGTWLVEMAAAAGLRLVPARVLVDGNRLPRLPMLAEAIIGGDAKVPAISAASILAKVHRDRWCEQIDAEYPQYGFAAHKGYGTAAHLAALRQHGPTPWHRRSFAPVAQALRQGLAEGVAGAC